MNIIKSTTLFIFKYFYKFNFSVINISDYIRLFFTVTNNDFNTVLKRSTRFPF